MLHSFLVTIFSTDRVLQKLSSMPVKQLRIKKKSVIFGYMVADPKAYGVMEFDKRRNHIWQ